MTLGIIVAVDVYVCTWDLSIHQSAEYELQRTNLSLTCSIRSTSSETSLATARCECARRLDHGVRQYLGNDGWFCWVISCMVRLNIWQGWGYGAQQSGQVTISIQTLRQLWQTWIGDEGSYRIGKRTMAAITGQFPDGRGKQRKTSRTSLFFMRCAGQ